jgi:hypothetical protein
VQEQEEAAAMADKFEREIDEILSKLDTFPKQGPLQRAQNRVGKRVGGMQRTLAVRLSRLSVSQIMLTGIAVILFAYFFRAALPGIWYYLVVFGLILFFTSFVLSFFGFSGPRSSRGRQVYWRGQPAQSYYSSEPTVFTRLRDWWRRRQSRG